MRVFAVVTCLIVAALAHPEAGYSYNGLQQNGGLPQNVHSLQPHIHQQLPETHSFANFGAPQMTYAAPAVDAPNSPDQIAPASDAPLDHMDSYNMAYQHSSVAHEGGYAYAPQQTQVHKHIYVHVPPKDFEDEDVLQPTVRHQLAPKQKHYKIVFIKAPAAPSVRPPVVPPPPQNEEKTLIYVLHKKPDAAEDIVIPTAAPTKPSKPEVYFIKYKTKKEEAPVYGPPPADVDPRHLEQPSNEYGAPSAEEFISMDNGDVSGPVTTIEPVTDEQPPQQFSNDIAAPSETYGAPTIAAFAPVEEPQPTVPSLPSRQYLAPKTTQAPIVVEEPQAPVQSQPQRNHHHVHHHVSSYGPPSRSSRFFQKKKK